MECRRPRNGMGRPDRPLLPPPSGQGQPIRTPYNSNAEVFSDLPPENRKQKGTLETDWPIAMGETNRKATEVWAPICPFGSTASWALPRPRLRSTEGANQ